MSLRESVWKGTLPKDHEDHIAEGFNSFSHMNPVHKFVPMRHAMKIPGAKAGSSGERMGEARKVAGVAMDQSKEQQ